ncbi:uncharacterized protein LOC144353838 [Saccoglossus kowalevskii]
MSIPGNSFKLNEESHRLGTLLRRKRQVVKKTLSQIKNTKRKEETQEKQWKLHIFSNDILDITNIADELQMCKNNCTNTHAALDGVSSQLDKERSINKELRHYIETLEGNAQCVGRKITHVKDKQRKRKLKVLESKAEIALWFTRSFGLTVNTLSATDEDKGEIIFNFSNNIITDSKSQLPCNEKEMPDVSPDVRIGTLPENEQYEIYELQHLLDRFSISNEAYHELTMTVSGKNLPRSYLVKQCRKNLNEVCHLEPYLKVMEHKDHLNTCSGERLRNSWKKIWT